MSDDEVMFSDLVAPIVLAVACLPLLAAAHGLSSTVLWVLANALFIISIVWTVRTGREFEKQMEEYR